MSAAPARGWAASLALHGLFLAALLAWVAPPPPAPARWRVSLASQATPVIPEPPQAAEPRVRQAQASRPVEAPAAAVPAPRATVSEAAPASPVSPPPPSAMPAAAMPAAAMPAAAMPSAPALAAPAVQARLPEPPPAPAPPPSADAAAWRNQLATRLKELKRYPLAARKQGQEGVVLLEATVLADGRTAAQVARSSGHPLLDRAALRLFEEAVASLAGQWRPAPDSRLEIPVAYRLDG